MLAWVLIATTDGSAVPAPVVRRVDELNPLALHFQPDEYLTWTNGTGSIHLSAWQAFGEVAGVGSRWHRTGGAVTLFSGMPWPRHGGWSGPRTWAAQLEAWLASNDPVADDEALLGIYSILHFDPAGRGRILADPFGAGGICTSRIGNLFIAGNRTPTIAAARTEPGSTADRDLHTLASILWSGSSAPVTEGSGFSQVDPLPQGAWIDLRPGEAPRIVPPRSPLMLVPDGFPSDLTLREAAEIVRDDLATGLHMAAALPASGRQLFLSGGKDSRLLAAIAHQEGILDRFELFTFGVAGNPDVTVAQQVGQALGQPVTWDDRSQSTRPEEFESRLRSHVFQVAGALGPWDDKSAQPADDVVRVIGNISEGIRPLTLAARALGSGEDAIRSLTDPSRFDNARLLLPHVRETLVAEVTAQVESMIAMGVSPYQVGNATNINAWSRFMIGTGANADSRPWTFPFLSVRSLRAALALPPSILLTEALPWLLISGAAPQLARVPFAADAWRPDLVGVLPEAASWIGVEPVPEQAGARHWRTEAWAMHQPVLARILADGSNPVWQVIDWDTTQRLLGSPHIATPHLRSLYSAAGGAIWMAGTEVRQPIGRPHPFLLVGESLPGTVAG